MPVPAKYNDTPPDAEAYLRAFMAWVHDQNSPGKLDLRVAMMRDVLAARGITPTGNQQSRALGPMRQLGFG